MDRERSYRAAAGMGRPNRRSARRGGAARSEHWIGFTVERDEDLLSWRSAGIERAMAEPGLPFFIEWAAGIRLPGRLDVKHPAGAPGIERLMIAGEPRRLSSWLDGRRLPVTLGDGGSGVIGVVLSTRSGEIVVGSKSQ